MSDKLTLNATERPWPRLKGTRKRIGLRFQGIRSVNLHCFSIILLDKVVRAILSCQLVGADKAYFTCNGEAMAAAERHKEEDRIEVAGDQVSKVALLFN